MTSDASGAHQAVRIASGQTSESHAYAALVCSFGRGVTLRYGLMILTSGNNSFACSVLMLGCTITSSPGIQLMGVVTLCLSPVWSESTMRSTSAELRPVE